MKLEPELLWDLYWWQGLSLRQVAQRTATYPSLVYKQMIELNIPTRPIGTAYREPSKKIPAPRTRRKFFPHIRRRKKNDLEGWYEKLIDFAGTHFRGGEYRVTTKDVFAYLNEPITHDKSLELKRLMWTLGWRGPQKMRSGTKTVQGYWRNLDIGTPAALPPRRYYEKEAYLWLRMSRVALRQARKVAREASRSPIPASKPEKILPG